MQDHSLFIITALEYNLFSKPLGQFHLFYYLSTDIFLIINTYTLRKTGKSEKYKRT